MPSLNQHNNFIFFTIALIALLLVSALGHSMPQGVGHLFSSIMTLATLGVAYLTLSFGRLWRPFVGVTLVLSLLLTVPDATTRWPYADLAGRVIGLVFFVGTAINCGRQVLLSQEIEANIIVGALALYLLLGIIWATFYMIILYFYPLAITGITSEPGSDNFARVLYFSYVTLATLGYGDISPANPVSKTFAYMEAVVGTFYLALVVASLIGGLRKPNKRKHNAS